MNILLRKLLGVLGLLAVATVPLAGRGQGLAPLEIYAAVPLTGPVAFIGQTTAKVFAAAETAANKSGGIQGHPLHFVVRDDQSNPAVAVQLMTQDLAKKPALVLAGMLASTCAADMPMLSNDGPVLICLTPSVQLPPGGWTYSVSVGSVDLYAAAIKYFRLKGYKKLGLLLTTDATGQDGDRTIPTILARPENREMTVVANEHFNVADISVTAQLARIKASGAQAIINSASGTPFGTVLLGLRDTGTTIPLWGSMANVNYTQLEGYRAIWPPVSPVILGSLPAMVPNIITDRAVRQSVDRFYTVMKEEGFARPDIAQILWWDPIQIVIAAYRKLGVNATAAQIKNYLDNVTDVPGISGKINFKANPQRGVSGDVVTLVKWDPETLTFTAVAKSSGIPL